MGETYLKMKNVEAAKAAFERVLTQHPDESVHGAGETIPRSTWRNRPPHGRAAERARDCTRTLCYTVTPTVLVADDEKNIRVTLEMVLSGAGYGVLQAPSAEHALEILKNPKRPVDLVILDLKLPGMNGLEALKHIRCGRRHPGFAGDRDQRTRDGPRRRRGHQARRDGLLREATEPRSRARQCRQLHPNGAPEPNRRADARRARTAVRDDRNEPADAGALPGHRQGRPDESELSHHRRERHRQRARQPRDPSAQPAQGRAVREGELRRDPERAHRKRALRPRTWLLHGRASAEAGLSSSKPTAARCFWTRLATWISPRRPRCFAHCKMVKSSGSDRSTCSTWTCVCSQQPTRTSQERLQEAHSARICFSGSTCFRSECRRSATVAPTSASSPKRSSGAFCRENGLRAKHIDPAVYEVLTGRTWPGNVRELKNVVERAAILSTETIITVADLPEDPHESPFDEDVDGDEDAISSSQIPVSLPPIGVGATLRQYRHAAERHYIIGVLKELDWNISASSRHSRDRAHPPPQEDPHVRHQARQRMTTRP